MLFLIEYDRKRGAIVSLRTFTESETKDAGNARLELELELNRREQEREVVILDAASEEAVRRTHRRYFEDLSNLMKPF
jgi:hypothetical protein